MAQNCKGSESFVVCGGKGKKGKWDIIGKDIDNSQAICYDYNRTYIRVAKMHIMEVW